MRRDSNTKYGTPRAWLHKGALSLLVALLCAWLYSQRAKKQSEELLVEFCRLTEPTSPDLCVQVETNRLAREPWYCAATGRAVYACLVSELAGGRSIEGVDCGAEEECAASCIEFDEDLTFAANLLRLWLVDPLFK